MSKLFSKPKALLGITLVLCMILSMLPLGMLSVSAAAWDGTIAESYAGGSGEEGDPYQIATGAQLAYFAQQVNAGNNYASTYFKLTSDIDLGDVAWTPIGSASGTLFRGILDGDGHAITNLSINATAAGAGLFGYVGYGTVIKNLSLEGDVSTSAVYAAGFVGYVTAGNTLTMSNCVFTGTITSTSTNSDYISVGAFVGHNWNATIKLDNCVAVNTTITTSKRAVGGLVGIAISGTDVTIKNSSFSGSISGERGVGGLVGGVYYGNGSTNATTVTIENSYSEGSITATATSGGLVGFTHNQNNNNKPITISIKDSYSTMQLPQDKGTAGLLGGNYAWEDYPSQVTVNITDSFFAGKAKFPIMNSATSTKDSTPMTVTLTNVYYLEGAATTATPTIGNLSPEVTVQKTVAEFADGTVAGLLNGGRTLWKQGTTHPVFEVETTPLATLTVGGEEVDLTANPFSYDAGEVSVNPLTIAATPAKTGAKVAITAVDGNDNPATVEAGAVTLAEGVTTTITIAVTYNFKTTNYTVTVYCKPGAWNGETATPFTVGNGEEATPYEIATPAQLKYLANQVNAGTTYSKKYFELTADIDLGGHEWTPIGNSSTNAFQGILEGNGHAITNLSIDSNVSYVGLFGYAAATIKNLDLEGDVKTSMPTAAGFVAYVPAAGNMTFENCTFTGTVEALHHSGDNVNVGGFVAYNWNSVIKITDCAVKGTITGKTDHTSARYEGTGGFVGTSMSGTDVIIKNSYFSGTVDASQRGDGVGGLVGAVWYSNGTYETTKIDIQNSYSEGTIKAQRMAGGLVGYVRVPTNNAGKKIAVTITDSYSTATVTSTGNNGGLLGGNYGYNDCPGDVTVNITDSFFVGSAKYGVMKKTDTQGTDDATKIMTVTLTKVYYKAGSATMEDAIIPAADHEKTAGEFADGTVAGLLGSGWATSTAGHPVHSTFTATTNALKLYGTSIRTSGTRGMRFHFKVNNNAQTSNLLECGVVLAKAANVPNGLYVGAEKSASVAAIDGGTKKFVREDITDDDGVYDWFTALLTFSSDANNETPYNARAYAVYEDDKGQEIVIYSDAIDGTNNTYNTLYNVAQKALEVAEDTDYSEAELEYLNSIVSKKN